MDAPTSAEADGAKEAAQPALGWEIPPHARILPYALVGGMALAWLLFAFESLDAGMIAWAVSAKILAEGRYETILLHMFAHAGLMHLLMNAAVLAEVGPLLIARMGPRLHGAFRFLLLFGCSGLAGLALYLAVHPAGTTPMLGASGAISGLVGLFVRLEPETRELVSLRSPQVWRAAKAFLKDNIVLFLLLTVPALLAGSGGGVAWEAHLGGFLFGLAAGPRFLARG